MLRRFASYNMSEVDLYSLRDAARFEWIDDAARIAEHVDRILTGRRQRDLLIQLNPPYALKYALQHAYAESALLEWLSEWMAGQQVEYKIP